MTPGGPRINLCREDVPGKAPHYYTPHAQSVPVKVPTHLLLLVNVDVQPAVLGPKPSLQQQEACKRGAVVLAPADHERALEVLKSR